MLFLLNISFVRGQNLQEVISVLGTKLVTDRADFFFEKYIVLDENLLNMTVNKQTSELEKKYQSLKKDNEILNQRSQIFIRNISLTVLAIFLMFGFISYKYFQNKQKALLQKEILYQQDLATKAVMNTEDIERKRMATQLHDGIAQLLSAALMNVNVLEEFKNDDQNFYKILDKTKNIMSDAILDVRTLSHQIMPNMLIKNSLADALRDLISKTTSTKLDIDLRVDGLQDNLNQNIQVVMYRIIQECINNTIKHANANKVQISIFQSKHWIEAAFNDNGKGFNPLKINSNNDGIGLYNIKSRVDMLKGELQIKSTEGEGTFIKMKIPL